MLRGTPTLFSVLLPLPDGKVVLCRLGITNSLFTVYLKKELYCLLRFFLINVNTSSEKKFFFCFFFFAKLLF